ncbi:MAG: prepilin-type N-terminal cleavage/methylation domain-containing protein [Clostridiaceae bacterium]
MVKNIATKKKKKGFTLIELIIVLAIMAILAAIAIPSFNAIRENSKIKADNQSAITVQKGVMTLVADGSIAVVKTGDKKFTLDYTSGSVVCNLTDTDENAFVIGGTLADGTVVKGVLGDVKAPQQLNKFKYEVTIAKDGKVSAEVK